MSSICKICNLEFKNNQSLAGHIRIYHRLTKKEYYDSFVKQFGEGICLECGGQTTFRGNRYLSFCSHKCFSNNELIRQAQSIRAVGKKQSIETIQKRIANTDQSKKEAQRSKTMLDKYGSLSTLDALNDNQKQIRAQKMSASLKGKAHSVEHHKKVIESKRKNGTLKHKPETKLKISNSQSNLYQSNDPPVPLIINSNGKNGRGHQTGKVNNLFYRSSYERRFLEYCFYKNINVESAATKEFRIQYKSGDEQKYRMYYPDFYLPDYGLVVEIKPLSMLDVGSNESKICAALCEIAIVLVTEEELEDLDSFFAGL